MERGLRHSSIIKLLNSKEEHIEDLKDETYYYHFEYEEEFIKDNNFILNFTILLSTDIDIKLKDSLTKIKKNLNEV